MQGRLSPILDGKIQSFPTSTWQQEFLFASELGLFLMEWTLDADDLYKNPLMNPDGRLKINDLCNANGILIKTLTGDCFMQRPFWKMDAPELKEDFRNIIIAASACGIDRIVVPLVDEGRLENSSQRRNLVRFLLDHEDFLFMKRIKICFESDFDPVNLREFIDEFPVRSFGINYDTGNSASLGWDVEKEFANYGERILNIHIKDRSFGGTTVDLGAGDVDFEKFFILLENSNYLGDLILQTARASNGDHKGKLLTFSNFVRDNCSFV